MSRETFVDNAHRSFISNSSNLIQAHVCQQMSGYTSSGISIRWSTYLAIQGVIFLIHATAWMNLNVVMISERNQTTPSPKSCTLCFPLHKTPEIQAVCSGKAGRGRLGGVWDGEGWRRRGAHLCGGRACSRSRLWEQLHGHSHMSNLIKLHTIYARLVVRQLCHEKSVKIKMTDAGL